MAYSTQANIQDSMSSAELTRLAALTSTGTVAAATARAIADADAEIDRWDTSGWSSAQKTAASVALAVEFLYRIDAKNNPVPKDVTGEANKWRDLFQMQEGVWTAVAYDPTLDETDDDLDFLLEGDD